MLRKAAAHSGRLISTGTSCGPASSAGWGHSGAAWQLRRRTQVSTQGWGWSAPGEFYSLHASQGALGALLGISSRDEPCPGRGLPAPSWGTVACTYVTSCPQHCVSPGHCSPGRPVWSHATHCDLDQALGSSSSASFPPGVPAVTRLRRPSTGQWEQGEAALPMCPTQPGLHSPLHGNRPGAQGHIRFWGVGSSPQGRSVIPAAFPPHQPRIYRMPGSLWARSPAAAPGHRPPPPPWAFGCRVGSQGEGRASGGKPPHRADCDPAETGR